jgi:hypothetical protein
MKDIKNDEIRQAVRLNYGKVAQPEGAGCCCSSSSCCGSNNDPTPEEISMALGTPVMMSPRCRRGRTWGLAVVIPRR